MAETILYSFAGKLLVELASPALKEIKLWWGFGGKDELEKLDDTVSTIKAVLLDAEQKQAKSHEVRVWLEKLEAAFYEADDLLDDLILMSQAKKIAFRVGMGYKVKVIREKLNAIAEDRKFHLTERHEEMRVENKTRETHSFVPAEEVVGRDKDKNAIIKLLLDSKVQEDVSIIPIVGIGGIGKTSLAQLVYNDEKLNENFEVKMWVCVSDIFDVKLIAQNIIESVTREKCNNVQMDVVKDHLKKQIDGKKYFLVLDDVWNEDPNLWLKLRDLLIGGASGSKILLTTRTQLVADIMGTVSPYLLEGLFESESWSLFSKRAFKDEVEPENPRVAIGKEIVKKCAGVPLALRTVGALLYTKDTEKEWLYFKDKELSELDQTESGIFPMLKLSYDYLPPHLKRCFAYCSLFPKDLIISKQTLIQLWMAHGFIHERNHLEDVGDQYFMELLRRSFFQDVSKDEEGNVTNFKMHDLLHDLAQLIAGRESFPIDWDAKDIDERARHVSVIVPTNSDKTMTIPFNLKANKLRTIILASNPKAWIHQTVLECTNWSNKTIASSKCVRVLDLHLLGIGKVSNSIGKLTHLRYLDLSHNNFQFLPKCICRLLNLQTLKLNGCSNLKELPGEIKNLVSLRHLELDDCSDLRHMPREFGQLTSLQTLSRFVVGHKDTSSVGFNGALGSLEGLVNLRGRLEIAGLRGGSIAEEARENPPKQHSYLARLEFLESLYLNWDRKEVSYDESCFESLRPHPNLKNLHIQWYNGVGFPSWMMVDIGLSLPNLVQIRMEGCHGCQHLTPFGLLPSLRVLDLCNMRYLQYIYKEEEEYDSSSTSSKARGLFPSLKTLKLWYLDQLKGLGGSRRRRRREVVPTAASSSSSLSTAKELLFTSSSFRVTPHLPVLEHLYIFVCPQLDLSAKDDENGVQFQSFRSLTYLCIAEISNLVSLTAGLQYLTSLQSLRFYGCYDLVALPESIGNLTSLRHLQIQYCDSLPSLPESMRCLTALQRLEVIGCRQLTKRCQKETGEDWPKIAHIPSITVTEKFRKVLTFSKGTSGL